ncbi:helix-turn-helix domain-containing protein [Sulfitobacter sp. 915]|uniref:helix-turn-helix domain-containing protein n=1 Tax=Sulfitobacter sp. 915 TaxID=3368558 RepID=UPI003745BA94
MIASQNAMILAHLRAGRSITFFDAVERFGVLHLPRRVKDLREAGHTIGDEWVKANGKRFKRYFLVKAAPQEAPEQGALL